MQFGLPIWIPNYKYWIAYNFFFFCMQLKLTFLSHIRYFVLKIYSEGYLVRYYNTDMLFGVPKKTNTGYQILFRIEKIRIPNTNTTIRSNYFNSIWIPNYLSHLAPILHWKVHFIMYCTLYCTTSCNHLSKWLADLFFGQQPLPCFLPSCKL